MWVGKQTLGVKLWVKVWVTDMDKPLCRAIPLWVGEGVKVWVVAFLGIFAQV